MRDVFCNVSTSLNHAETPVSFKQSIQPHNTEQSTFSRRLMSCIRHTREQDWSLCPLPSAHAVAEGVELLLSLSEFKILDHEFQCSSNHCSMKAQAAVAHQVVGTVKSTELPGPRVLESDDEEHNSGVYPSSLHWLSSRLLSRGFGIQNLLSFIQFLLLLLQDQSSLILLSLLQVFGNVLTNSGGKDSVAYYSFGPDLLWILDACAYLHEVMRWDPQSMATYFYQGLLYLW